MRSAFLAQMARFAAVLALGRAYRCWSRRDCVSFRSTAQFGLRRSLRPFLMSCFLTEQVHEVRKETATYKSELCFLQSRLDEKIVVIPPCVSWHSCSEVRGL